ncbi:MAG: hypothetical protein LBK56_05965, partial [Gracilibacteraceae bacterium]|nr:hypothetical protein [Gracilibacteraceae bacterium]
KTLDTSGIQKTAGSSGGGIFSKKEGAKRRIKSRSSRLCNSLGKMTHQPKNIISPFGLTAVTKRNILYREKIFLLRLFSLYTVNNLCFSCNFLDSGTSPE